MSVHEATRLPPTDSSLPLMRISSAPVISTVERWRVMTGGVVSGAGIGEGVCEPEVSFSWEHEVNKMTNIHANRNTAVARNAATGVFEKLADG